MSDAWWSPLPLDRTVFLDGTTAEAVALATDPLPEGAPAVVIYRPISVRTQAGLIEAVLSELESIATKLFPAWLPEAAYIEGPGGGGVAALRALALKTAVKTRVSAAFLADLAEQSLVSAPSQRRHGDDARAVGLAWAVATSYGRERFALVLQIPVGLDGAGEETVAAACDWLTYRGQMAVWLTGSPLRIVDRIPRIQVQLPLPRGSSADELVGRMDADEAPLKEVSYPPIAGKPHSASPFEAMLERRLKSEPWATGRHWNHTYTISPLENEVRLDLYWPHERCVVEIDGDEHRRKAHYAADRWRDAGLQLNGLAVLRFTNEQVQHDLDSVVRRIEHLIQSRRQS